MFITIYKLAQIYRAFGIKQKKVKALPKFFTPHLEAKRRKERRNLFRSLEKCDREDLDILFLDETVFVFR